AIDKVVQRFHDEEQRQQERREQKEQDEHAARPQRK
ncbi:MAG: flagellar export protein FliJ, partial [Planctomycetia bacterium]|nr:flagellar export protein FliJ [Planctomycetia bacterium]